MSACPSVRMNAEMLETIRARMLGLSIQIRELSAQGKFVSAGCHAHSNAHNAKTRLAAEFVNIL